MAGGAREARREKRAQGGSTGASPAKPDAQRRALVVEASNDGDSRLEKGTSLRAGNLWCVFFAFRAALNDSPPGSHAFVFDVGATTGLGAEHGPLLCRQRDAVGGRLRSTCSSLSKFPVVHGMNGYL